MGPLTLSYIDTPKTYMSLASQPQWCRNVAAEVDGRDRYHPRFLSHHQTVYFVSPREPRTRHLITKPRPLFTPELKILDKERVHVSARPNTPILAGFVDLLWWEDRFAFETFVDCYYVGV